MEKTRKCIVIKLPIEKHREIKTVAASLGLTIINFIEESVKFFIENKKINGSLNYKNWRK